MAENSNQIKFIIGAKWNSVSTLYRQLWIAFVMMILARILGPEDFGLIGMTMVLVQFFNIFISLGFEASIVQAESISQIQLSTLLWINIIAGIIFTLIGLLFSPYVALFYSRPELEHVFSLLAIILVFNSFGLVQRALLLRELHFTLLAKIEILSATIAGLCAILFAVGGFGYWSLVIQQISLSALSVIGYWVYSKWRPSLTFDWYQIVHMFKYSVNVFYFNILNFFTHNIDVVFIGRLVGSEQLGLYLMAHNIIYRPIQQILLVLRKSLFPIVSRLQDDLVDFRRIYTDAIRSLFIIVSPLLLIIVYPFYAGVPIILGVEWVPIFPFILILCISSMLVLIGSPVGVIFLATGKPEYQWKLSLSMVLPISLIGMVIGYLIFNSALGIVFVHNIFKVILIVPGIYIAFRLISLNLGEFLLPFKNVMPGIIILIIINAVSYLFEQYLDQPIIITIIHCTISIVVYIYIILPHIPAGVMNNLLSGLGIRKHK